MRKWFMFSNLKPLRVILAFALLIVISSPFINMYAHKDILRQKNKPDTDLGQLNFSSIMVTDSRGNYDASLDSITEDDKYGLVEEILLIEPTAKALVGQGGVLRYVWLTNKDASTFEGLLYEPVSILESGESSEDLTCILDSGYIPIRNNETYIGYLTLTGANVPYENRELPVYRTYREGALIYPLEHEYRTESLAEEIVYLEGSLLNQSVDHYYLPGGLSFEEDHEMREELLSHYEAWIQ